MHHGRHVPLKTLRLTRFQQHLMNKKTFTKRYDTLLRDISVHPYKEELLNLMYQQVQDDVDTASTLSRSTHQLTNF